MIATILQVSDLVKYYRLQRLGLFGSTPVIAALDGVSFTIPEGRSVGIVGESGCGKSTLAKTVMGLETPTTGSVHLLGHDLAMTPPNELRRLRRHFQMVFQDPYGSLDPRSKVGSIVAEPLEAVEGGKGGRARILERVRESLESVGLRAGDLDKFPHEFSGGQRQRIAIARALATRPKLIVADEPVSALDVSVQAQVLNLLLDLRERYGLSYLLISHDLAVVEYVCDETAVMYQGRIVEMAPARALFRSAAHPYTRLLRDAVPKAGTVRRRSSTSTSTSEPEPDGDVVDWSGGCAFRIRCTAAQTRCQVEAPRLTPMHSGHIVACHFPGHPDRPEARSGPAFPRPQG